MAALVLAEPGTPRLLRCFDDSSGAVFSWARGVACTGAPAADRNGGGAPPQPRTGPCPYPGVVAFIESVCAQARMSLPACCFTGLVRQLHACQVCTAVCGTACNGGSIMVAWPACLQYHGEGCTAVQGGVQGRVRSWVAWPEAGLLLLNMRDNRWCAGVGRAHARNGIFYVVDLQARLIGSLLSCHGKRCARWLCVSEPSHASNGIFNVVDLQARLVSRLLLLSCHGKPCAKWFWICQGQPDVLRCSPLQHVQCASRLDA